MTYDAAFDLATNGSLLLAADSVYTEAIGEWWRVLIFVTIVLIVLYIGTRSSAVLAGAVLAGTGAAFYWMPVVGHPILYIIGVLSLGWLLYRVFGKNDAGSAGL